MREVIFNMKMQYRNVQICLRVLLLFTLLQVTFNTAAFAQPIAEMIVTVKDTGAPVEFGDHPGFSAIYITYDIPNLNVSFLINPIFITEPDRNNKALLYFVTPTEHKIVFEADGYQKLEYDITTLTGEQVIYLHVERYIPKPMLGKIHVISMPTGAKVSLLGSAKSYISPATIDSLAAGTYTIEVALEGYETITFEVVLSEDEERTINFTLVSVVEEIAEPPIVEVPPPVTVPPPVNDQIVEKEGTLKLDSMSASMVKQPSRGTSVALSIAFPGAGQIYSKRGIGWLWAVAGAGSAAFGVLSYQNKMAKVKAFDSAYANYLNAQNVELARQYRAESEAHYTAMEKAHDNMMVGFGALAAVYAVQLIDALIAKPKTVQFSEYSSLSLQSNGTLVYQHKLRR